MTRTMMPGHLPGDPPFELQIIDDHVPPVDLMANLKASVDRAKAERSIRVVHASQAEGEAAVAELTAAGAENLCGDGDPYEYLRIVEPFSMLQKIRATARSIAARYGSVVDWEDIAQELWAHVASTNKYTEWEDVNDVLSITNSLSRHAKLYCEREKAAVSGYDVRDVAWYDPDILEELLELALDDRWDGTGVLGEDADDGQPRAKSDAAVGGTLLAMVMDVRRAVKATGSRDAAVLADWLGGDYPGSKSSEHVGRKAMSNAAARDELADVNGTRRGSE